MKSIALLVSIFCFVSASFAGGDHHHDHGHKHHDKHEKQTPSKALHLDNGKKWPTDKPLRDNMASIHQHLKNNIDKFKKNILTDKEYQVLGNQIGKNINSIFSTCKLPAAADAQLHIIMASLLNAKNTLIQKGSLANKRTAVEHTLSSYKDYLKFFKTDQS